MRLLEFDSIAVGIEAGDSMVKRAPVERIVTGTVQPGHFLIMVTGDVASVEEAVAAGKEGGRVALIDVVFLPHVHSDVVTALMGGGETSVHDALGIIETRTVASSILAADAGLKGADVQLVQLRLADGLGGKGLALFAGVVADVEAAVEIGSAVSVQQLIRQVVIPQLHGEMWANVGGNGRFGSHFNWGTS